MILNSNNSNARYVSYEEKKDNARLATTPRISKELDEELKDKKFNVLESASTMKIIDLISEGPIEGFSDQNTNTLRFFKSNRNINFPFLQSVFLDETKVYNPESGTFNYKIFDLDYREGREVQDPLPDTYEFAAQSISKSVRLVPSNSTHVNIKKRICDTGGSISKPKEFVSQYENIASKSALHEHFKNATKHMFAVTHTVVNPLVEIVRISLTVHVLSKLKTGKRSSKQVPEELSFLIFVGNETGEIDFENPPLYEVSEPVARDDGYRKGEMVYNDTGGYFVKVVKGLSTSDYVFENTIHLPPNPNKVNRVIKVFRIEDTTAYDSNSSQVEGSLHSITEVIPYKLYYPNCAIIGTTLDARSFTQIPNRKFDLKLLKVKVPSNYLPDIKEYSGNWNGRFKSTINRADPKEEFDIVQRAKAKVKNYTQPTENGGDDSSNVKVVTNVKKFGSGSIFFASSNSLGINADYAKRISINKPEEIMPLRFDDGPKVDLRVGDFGFLDFTIEFYIKTSASQTKTFYKTADGSSHTTAGIEGIYKTILSSGEGNPPCSGFNRSDDQLGSDHPREFEGKLVKGRLNDQQRKKKAETLPLAGNWFVQIGTANGKDVGQIVFRYFIGQGYWTRENRRVLPSRGLGNGKGVWHNYQKNSTSKNSVETKVSVKSLSNIADDNWHHVAITREGNSFKIYIDGVENTDSNSAISTYNGDVRGFVYRSETDEDASKGGVIGTGLINIGNDRSIARDGTTEVHTSFNGYLDHVHVIRRCKYTSNFNSVSHPNGGTGVNPTRITDLIDNEIETVFLLNGDSEPDNSTFIDDYNPSIVTAAELFDYERNESGADLQWTDNPAWIFYDLVTNKRYGLGKYGVSSDFVNKWNLYELAKHCDELVRTGFPAKYGNREFEVVDGIDGQTVASGNGFIKINGFQNQAEFEKEFPNNGKIAIFNLNDNAQAVHRRIKYIQSDEGSVKDGSSATGKLLSYKAEPNAAGSAVIEIQKLISAEEAFILNPALEAQLAIKALNENNASQEKTSKELVLNYINDKSTDDDDTVKLAFNVSQKINDTSTSGFCSSEFKNEFDVLEPRFTCNLYLTTAVDAFKVLNDLASVFRGLTYIVGGKVFASFDKERLPVMNFTNANVKGGDFRYTGSPKTSRFTTAVVRYVDKHDNFRPKVEYVEDPDGIIKYGLIEKELVAFGCSSRGQARRLGEWFLFTSQLETETVKFSAGKEASYLRPGDVVKIIDKNKVSKRYGGRIINIDGVNAKVTLDSHVAEDVVGQKITIAIPRAFETEGSLDQSVSKKEGVPDDKLANQRAQQIKEFEVSAVEEDNSVPAKKSILTLTNLGEANVTEVGKIKVGAVWILQNSEENLKIQEVLYRVMNVSEQSPMEYDLLCLEYNNSKFDSFEKDLSLDKVRYKGVATPSDQPIVVDDVDLSISRSTERYVTQGRFETVRNVIVQLGPKTAATLENGDIINIYLVLKPSSVVKDQDYGKELRVAESYKVFDKNGQKRTSFSVELINFQGTIVSQKIVIEKNSGTSNTGLPN